MLRIRKVEEMQYSRALMASLAAAALTAVLSLWVWFFQYPGDSVLFVISPDMGFGGFFSQTVEENPATISSMSVGIFCTIIGLAVSLAYAVLHFRRTAGQRADISEIEILVFRQQNFRNILAWMSMSVVLSLLVGLGTELAFQLMALIARDTLLVPPIVAVIISSGYVAVLAFFISRWMLGLLTIDILAMGVFVLVIGVLMAILLTTYSDWYKNPFSVLGELLRDDSGTVTNRKSALIFSYTFIAVGVLMFAYFWDMNKFFGIMVKYRHLERFFALVVFVVGIIGSCGMLLVGAVPDGLFHDLGAEAAGAAFVGMMLLVPWFVPTRRGRDKSFVAFSAGLGLLSIALYIYHVFFPENLNLLGMELAGISFTVIFLYTFTVHSLSYIESLDLPDVVSQAVEVQEVPKAA